MPLGQLQQPLAAAGSVVVELLQPPPPVEHSIVP